MGTLVTCAECQRHVRETETECPFCRAAVLPRSKANDVVLGARLSRAALIMAGASALAACGKSTTPPDDRGGSSIAAPYGVPVILDAAPPPPVMDAAPPPDVTSVVQPYGAPPIRDAGAKKKP